MKGDKIKSGFLTDDFNLKLHPQNDEVWILHDPLIYDSKYLGCRITVPSDFYTDLASVPRIPLIWLLWGYRAHREAVIHDYLYRTDAYPNVSCMAANRVFFEAMSTRGKKWTVKYPMYCGVVLGGWTAHHKRAVNDKFNKP